MRTYRFESIIQDNGCIFLPEYMKKSKSHHLKLTLVDLEKVSWLPKANFYEK